ncbi:MAG TPA: pilus assembly protein PilM [Casimicrobiaceae bacterium]|nr:pilus assembly protein PilM [Casimicrobiaceae bacterium]
MTASVRPRAFGPASPTGSFIRWWLSELGAAMPKPTRDAVRRRRMRTVLAFDNDAVTIWRPALRDGALVMEPGERVALAADAAATAAEGRAALARIGNGAGAPRVAVALPSRQVLRRALKLPAAVEENLLQALAYDLDRHTPFKADELYFDAEVVERDPRGEIRIDLAAARRSLVDQAIAQAESFGAEVVAVVPTAPADAATTRLNLLPPERRAASAGLLWRIGVPALALAVLAAVAIAVPVWQKRDYAIALLRIVDDARVQASVSERLRSDLERHAAEYNFALERKFAFPSSLQVLEEITKLLPDDTWLTQMEMKTASRGKETQRELLLRGESVNAGRLINAFEESKVFTQAAPRSPTTKIQPGPGEIFDLAAQLRPLPAPTPVALAALAPVATPAAPVPTPTPAVAPSAPPPSTPTAAPSAAPPTTPARQPASAPAPTPPPANAPSSVSPLALPQPTLPPDEAAAKR